MCCKAPCRYSLQCLGSGLEYAQASLPLLLHICMVEVAIGLKEETPVKPQCMQLFLTGIAC